MLKRLSIWHQEKVVAGLLEEQQSNLVCAKWCAEKDRVYAQEINRESIKLAQMKGELPGAIHPAIPTQSLSARILFGTEGDFFDRHQTALFVVVAVIIVAGAALLNMDLLSAPEVSADYFQRVAGGK